jgi:uncharacterized protein YkwD
MFKQIKNFIFVISTLLILISNFAVGARSMNAPLYEGTAYDLINAVNALRAAYGLPAYSINSILMFTAQNQADFMSSNGIVTHSGPGGSTMSQRLLAAGYPLAGDLSLGGFRSENISSSILNKSLRIKREHWTSENLFESPRLGFAARLA